MEKSPKRRYSKKLLEAMEHLISTEKDPDVYGYVYLDEDLIKCLSEDEYLRLPYFIRYKDHFFHIHEWWEMNDIYIMMNMIKIKDIIV